MSMMGIGSQDHYYVYRFRNGVYWYERTCGTEEAARGRVAELNLQAVQIPGEGSAVWIKNHTINGAFY